MPSPCLNVESVRYTLQVSFSFFSGDCFAYICVNTYRVNRMQEEEKKTGVVASSL